MQIRRADDQAAPLRGGAVRLGGTAEFSVPTMLSPYGAAPGAPNGMNNARFGTEWLLARVKELVALGDHPFYSFMLSVEAATREDMRTTSAVGVSAVAELYPSQQQVRNRFYAPMPGTMHEEQRLQAASRLIPSDSIQGRSAPAPAVGRQAGRPVTGAGGFPVVGAIGESIDAFAIPSAASLDQAAVDAAADAATQPLAPGIANASLLEAERAARGERATTILLNPGDTLNPSDPVVNNARVRTTRSDAQTNNSLIAHAALPVTDDAAAAGAGMVDVAVVDPTKNVSIGGTEFAYDLENGESTLLRRLNKGQPMSQSDFDAWRTLYAGGVGVTHPAPRKSETDAMRIREQQRGHIQDFVLTHAEWRELNWRQLPEHLHMLFLTPVARMALEHAAWFAQFQQPSDPGRPIELQVPNSAYASDRQRVPVIDLITHAQVRVPFQTLVINLILYWKHRRLADSAAADYALKQINQVMQTLKTMREEKNGFVSLMHHYDVEAQASRHDRAREREREYAATGVFHSDMDREFYSQAQRPGRHVTRLLESRRAAPAHSLPPTRALQTAARAAPYASVSAIIDDARRRDQLVRSVLGYQL